MPSRILQWEAQEHLTVPFNSTPVVYLPILLFFSLDYLDSSEEEDGDNQNVNIQREQNWWVRQLRSSRAVIIPKKPSLSPVVSSADVATVNGGLSHPQIVAF